MKTCSYEGGRLLIPVVLYSEEQREDPFKLGSFPPSEIASLIALIKENGACIADCGFGYVSSAYDLEHKRIEIVVSHDW
jgi:hypothetical protein